MAITWAWCCAYDIKGCLGIISYLAIIHANKKGDIVSFIDNLKIIKIFKDKNKKEEASVTDFIY